MAVTKYLNLEQLTYYNGKIKETYVAKEHKTGSEDEWKVLSDNNLTDELVQKIHNAGDSGFNGSYESLTNKPAIDSHELSAESTAEELGLAKKEELPKVATTAEAGLVKPDGSTITITEEGIISAAKQEVDLSLYAKKDELPKKATDEIEGIVKVDNTTITVDDGTITAVLPDVSDMLTKTEAAQEYAKTTAIADMLTKTEAEKTYQKTTDMTDYVKQEKVTEDIEAAKTELTQAIDAKVSGVYTPKGDTEFAELPEPSKETLGHVYNVTDAFVTDEKFAKQSESYPAGTNVVVVDMGGDSYKYDALSGVIDLSTYAKKDELSDYVQSSTLEDYIKSADLEAITTGEIDALFAPVI